MATFSWTRLVGMILGVLFLSACGSDHTSPTTEPIDVSRAPLESLAAGAIVLGEEVGRVDLTGQNPAGNSEILKQAGVRAQALGASMVLIGSDGRLTAQVVNDDETAAVAARSFAGVDSGMVVAKGAPPPPSVPPSVGATATTDPMVPKEMSTCTDNRYYLGSPYFNGWSSSLSRVGTISGAPPDDNCSGTLIGNRLVWTAAHCMWLNSDGSLHIPGYFTPQQHGSAGGGGGGWSSWAPWTTANIIGDAVDTAWLSMGCYNNPLAGTCPRYDFLIAILQTNPFTGPLGHPGYCAFGYGSDSYLAGLSIMNIGYPACTVPANPPSCDPQVPPAGCLAYQPYGDLFNCSVEPMTFGDASSGNQWPWSASDNPSIHTGCDASEGQSGSPIFGTINSDPAVVLADLISGWPQPYGSKAVRINATLFNYLLTMRTSYP